MVVPSRFFGPPLPPPPLPPLFHQAILKLQIVQAPFLHNSPQYIGFL